MIPICMLCEKPSQLLFAVYDAMHAIRITPLAGYGATHDTFEAMLADPRNRSATSKEIAAVLGTRAGRRLAENAKVVEDTRHWSRVEKATFDNAAAAETRRHAARRARVDPSRTARICGLISHVAGATIRRGDVACADDATRGRLELGADRAVAVSRLLELRGVSAYVYHLTDRSIVVFDTTTDPTSGG